MGSRGFQEDQDHLGSCEGYEDLREGKDMGDDNEPVEFYQSSRDMWHVWGGEHSPKTRPWYSVGF